MQRLWEATPNYVSSTKPLCLQHAASRKHVSSSWCSSLLCLVALPAPICRVTGSVFLEVGKGPWEVISPNLRCSKWGQPQQAAAGFVHSSSEHLRGQKNQTLTSSVAYPHAVLQTWRSLRSSRLSRISAHEAWRPRLFGHCCVPSFTGTEKRPCLPGTSPGSCRFAPWPAEAAWGGGPSPPREVPRQERPGLAVPSPDSRGARPAAGAQTGVGANCGLM